MPRPKKNDEARKGNRLTVYLTEQEAEALKVVSEQEDRPMTQIVTTAVRDWLLRLLDPPESLRKAKHEKIMEEQSEMVRGFICERGHIFWVDWSEPMDPRRCPMCGMERNIKRTWSGTVNRGF